MKLASLKEGGHDGTLIIVNRELTRGVRATGIAATLQLALESWGSVAPRLNALFEGLQAGVVVAEGIWANRAHRGGVGINMLTGSDEIAPYGGAAFHDTKVWLRKL